MITIDRILCPVDLSAYSRQALDYAIGMARWFDASVTVLNVSPIAVPSAAFAIGAPAVMEPLVTSLVEHEKLRADVAAFANAKPSGKVPIDVETIEGQPWREIASRAEAIRADLLVMGTHGRSGFERLLLGSVTEKLLRTAPCPVLTVPSAPVPLPIAPGLFKRILCPIDFSAASERALRWATSLAQEADAELFVLHVFEEHAIAGEGAFPHAALAAYREEYESWCAGRLHETVPDAVRAWCTVHELTASGATHAEILRAAADHLCDLIVMGVGGHRSIGDRIFGSTTQHVVRAATCPVLTTMQATGR